MPRISSRRDGDSDGPPPEEARFTDAGEDLRVALRFLRTDLRREERVPSGAARTVLQGMRLSEREGMPLEDAVAEVRAYWLEKNGPAEETSPLRERMQARRRRGGGEEEIVMRLARERAREVCSREFYEFDEAVAAAAEEIVQERAEERAKRAASAPSEESFYSGERLQRLADSIEKLR